MVAIAAAMLFASVLHGNRAVAGTPVIVAFGDSLTAGFGLQNSDSFPAQLEKALKARGQDVKLINAGVSGDTAAAGLARLDWALPDDASGVIIELGANDAQAGPVAKAGTPADRNVELVLPAPFVRPAVAPGSTTTVPASTPTAPAAAPVWAVATFTG